MNHKTHLYLMVGLALAAILLFSTGNGGGWVLYAGLGACAVMMFFMMGGMGGMGGGQRRGEMDHDIPEGLNDESARRAGRDHRR